MRGATRLLWGLCALLVLTGGLPLLGMAGAALLAPLAAGWSLLFGWLQAPLAAGLLVVGAWLGVWLAQGNQDPWRLPWGRALAVEVVVVGAVALLALSLDAGGRVGWALAESSRQAVGAFGAVVVWATAGIVGALLTFRIGTDRLAAWFESVATALDEPAGSGDPQGEDGGARQDMPTTASARARSPRGSGTHAPAADQAGGRAVRAQELLARNAGTRPGAAESGGQAQSQAPQPGAPTDSATSDAPAPALPARPSLAPGHAPPLRLARGRASTARRVGRATALPEIALLGEDEVGALDSEGLRAIAERIEQTLEGFGVPTQVVEIEHGPTVTRFGLVPGTFERAGETRRVKVARITALRDDLALALSAPSIRIEAPVPGKAMVGIEIPNPETAAVGLAGLLRDRRFRASAAKSGLTLALGRDVSGGVAAADLAKMPHLLIAGATGSGKSVCLNTILASLLFQNTPDMLRLVLVDPKRVELSQFKRLPHLVAPVVTDVVEVVGALRWAAAEMDRRYKAFAERGARDLKTYNRKLPTGEPALPRIVVVIDELADLMLQAPGETEPLLTRLAQLARATGIHLIVATQRPSTDVITGLIKANFPARIAFAVSSSTDSRVILDRPGAEALLGSGDMLFQPPDAPNARRLQGAFVSDGELERLIAFWKDSPWAPPPRLPPWDDLIPPDDPEEALYEEAVAVALTVSRVSASLLQRRLKLGYGRARALFDRMQREGLVDDEGKPDRGPDPEEVRSWDPAPEEPSKPEGNVVNQPAAEEATPPAQDEDWEAMAGASSPEVDEGWEPVARIRTTPDAIADAPPTVAERGATEPGTAESGAGETGADKPRTDEPRAGANSTADAGASAITNEVGKDDDVENGENENDVDDDTGENGENGESENGESDDDEGGDMSWVDSEFSS